MFHLINNNQVLSQIDSHMLFWSSNYRDRLTFSAQEADSIICGLPKQRIEKVEEDQNAVAGKIAYFFYSKYRLYFELETDRIHGNVFFEPKGDRYLLVQLNCKSRGIDRICVDLASKILLFAPGLSKTCFAVEIGTGRAWWDESNEFFQDAKQVEKCLIAISDLCAIKLFNELEWLGSKLMVGRK